MYGKISDGLGYNKNQKEEEQKKLDWLIAHTEYSETLPVPYFGFEYGTFIGKLYYLKMGIRYMGLNVRDYDAEHFDYNVALSYQLSGDDCLHDLMFDVGYRYINYDVEGKGNDIDLSYKGPYVSFDVLF